MTAYYNEFDPFAAAWLQQLIAAGHIAPGVVDTRSIEDVLPSDLEGFTQCHFFAGIGVWSYALRRAGWSDDRPIWTGSCPCQPFSAAGKGNGFADKRHLWPAFLHLIKQRGPAVVAGEQVASKDGLAWLDTVQADVENAGYAFGAADLCAAGFGAPHIRQRSFWVAKSQRSRRQVRQSEWAWPSPVVPPDAFIGLADNQLQQRSITPARGNDTRERREEPAEVAGFCGDLRPGPTNGHWRDVDWLGCRDGKWRPVEPGTFPLVNGATNRVGRLRGYGNAIVAPVAQGFIEAVMECLP